MALAATQGLRVLDRQMNLLPRRIFITGLAGLGPLTVFGRSPQVDFTFTQFHNQPASSTLHKHLVEMWAAIRTETRGRVDTQVFAENNRIPGSDPAALDMLVSGEIQFFTLMGGILGNVVPATEVQQVPFAFRAAGTAHRALDGADNRKH